MYRDQGSYLPPGSRAICDDCRKPFTIRRGFERICLPCWKVRKGYEVKRPLLVEDLDMIKQMIRLVHPDRHQGSSLESVAHDVTIYLLDLLKKGRDD